jgi:ketosteroid isomerase-like protein
MSDQQFVAFAKALDECWMRDRFSDLPNFLADDVVFVGPGGEPRISGLADAVDSYRQFKQYARIPQFRTADYQVTERGDTAVVEYGWEMTWVASDEEHHERGRELLVLARRNDDWRVVWRTQIPKSTDR